MKRTMLGLVAALMVAASVGCCCGKGGGCGLGGCGLGGLFKRGGGDGCAAAGCGPAGHLCGLGHANDMYAGEHGGPATGAVTYPYYTTRGPRDFLAANPRGIGP